MTRHNVDGEQKCSLETGRQRAAVAKPVDSAAELVAVED